MCACVRACVKAHESMCFHGVIATAATGNRHLVFPVSSIALDKEAEGETGTDISLTEKQQRDSVMSS